MKALRVGIVGMGHLGNYHLQKYLKMPDVKVVGVSDLIREKAQRGADVCNGKACLDYGDLIGQVDAASITVPTQAHYQTAKAFLAEGKDVLLEKPIAADCEEADELIALAESKNLILQIGFVERFNPAIIALGDVLHNPLFIEIHRLHPFFERGTDVDVILDLMVHDLDILLHFVASPIRSLEAVGASVLSDKPDIANARLTFASGCVANITASRITTKTLQKIRFFCSDGYHAVDYAQRELLSLKSYKGEDGKSQIIENKIDIRQQDPLEEEIRSFVHAVRTRSKPVVSGREGRDVLELAMRISKEISRHRPSIAGG
jgi:predicted dehydrogenase